MRIATTSIPAQFPRRPFKRALAYRGGSSVAVVLGCVLIVALLGFGLLLASNLARRVTGQTRQQARQQTLAMNNDLSRAVRSGLEESQQDSADPDESEQLVIRGYHLLIRPVVLRGEVQLKHQIAPRSRSLVETIPLSTPPAQR